MRSWIRVLLGAMLALTAIGSACGEDGDTLSAEDYYKKLETIGREADEKTSENASSTPESDEPQATKDWLARILSDGVTVGEEAAKKLEGLKPPDDVKPKHDTFVTAVKAEIEAFKKIRDTINDTPVDQIEALLPTLNLGSATEASDTACNALQDDAASKSITVDLKCGD